MNNEQLMSACRWHAIEIALLDAQANRLEKRRKKTTTAKVGVWLASISIRFWMKDEANGFPVKVPYGGSVCKVFRQKILKVRGAKKHPH